MDIQIKLRATPLIPLIIEFTGTGWIIRGRSGLTTTRDSRLKSLALHEVCVFLKLYIVYLICRKMSYVWNGMLNSVTC